MVVISILVYIMALAISYSNKNEINNLIYIRISSIVFIFAGILSINIFYTGPIGYGIGIYGGLFQITNFSSFADIFLLFIAALVLVPRPSNLYLIDLNLLKLNFYKLLDYPFRKDKFNLNLELFGKFDLKKESLNNYNSYNTNLSIDTNLIYNF